MSNHAQSPEILVILGPTASGKSSLAVKLAKKYRGEVISADSRQVYRGLDIGTAKVPGRWQVAGGRLQFLYKGVRHHLIDFASPRRQYSPAEYAEAGRKILYTLLANGYLPIICGGTGQYIDALLGAHPIPDVPPDAKLRAILEKLSAPELFARLRKLDPRRARTLDRQNPRRLIRALEIVMKTGRPIPKLPANRYSDIPRNVGITTEVDVVKIGLNPLPEELRRRINARLAKDLRRGLIAEVKKLHAQGLSWKRLNELGLEYRLVARYLRGLMTHNELLTTLQTELWRYTKRQMRWFKRDINTRWAKNERAALRFAKQFLARKRKTPNA